MTTKTRRDLIEHALAELGVLAAGQDPATEDFDAVSDHVDPTLAMLAARDIPVPDLEDVDNDLIPLDVFLPLATLLANEVASHFGLTSVPAPQGFDPVLAAETKLREIGYSRPSYEPQKTMWF